VIQTTVDVTSKDTTKYTSVVKHILVGASWMLRALLVLLKLEGNYGVHQ
jgi:hypothetical protein